MPCRSLATLLVAFAKCLDARFAKNTELPRAAPFLCACSLQEDFYASRSCRWNHCQPLLNLADRYPDWLLLCHRCKNSCGPRATVWGEPLAFLGLAAILEGPHSG